MSIRQSSSQTAHTVQLTFQQHEQLFHELLQLSKSGMPFKKSLDVIGRGRSHVLARCASRLASAMEGSDSAGLAFRQAGFSESVVEVIAAAERTGTLPQNFERLAGYYGRLAQARQRFIRACLYPLFVFHLAAVLLPLGKLVQDGLGAYLGEIIFFLGSFYVFAFVVFALWKLTVASFQSNTTAAAILRKIPLLGGFLEDFSAWKFSQILSLYVGAGGSPLSGLEAAARASGNAEIRSIVDQAVPRVRAGESLSDAINHLGGLPSQIERAIQVGEHAGRLDEETGRAASIYEQNTASRIDMFAEWVPRLMYVGMLVFIALRILSSVSQAFAPLNDLMQ